MAEKKKILYIVETMGGDVFIYIRLCILTCEECATAKAVA